MQYIKQLYCLYLSIFRYHDRAIMNIIKFLYKKLIACYFKGALIHLC